MIKVFRLKVILLLVLVFTSANIGLKASHIIGAEISYKHIDGYMYRFTLKVFRDCNECKFNNNGGGNNTESCPEVPNLRVRGALNTPYNSDIFGDVTLTRTNIVDLTPTCYSALSKCKNGSTINHGFEVQEFEGVYNFNNLVLNGKCEFDISIAVSSRSAAINSIGEQNFFNYCYINLCNGIQNQSTRFDLPPVFTLLQNQTHNIALGFVNGDNDSLAFKLKPALVNRRQNVDYNVGRSYSQPFAVFCSFGAGCSPNPVAPIPEGFYISEQTGDLIFTPILQNEGGVMVVECEEWKKTMNGTAYLAGVTRRDIYAEVISATNNLPKIKNNELNISICEGETFNYLLNIEDLKLFSVLSDTVEVDMVSNLPGLILEKNTLNLPPYNFYNIFLANSNNQKGKYYITISARDNNCPLRGVTSKTILLNILQKRKVEFIYKTRNCGLLQVDNNNKNQVVRWVLTDLNNNELKRQIGTSLTCQLPNGGKYILRSTLEATIDLCAVYQVDTLDIENFTIPELDLGDDLLVCKNSQVVINPVKLNTFNPYKVFLNNDQVTFPHKFYATENRNLVVKVLQDNGCYAEDILYVNLHPTLGRTFINDTICSNFNGLIDIDNLITADRSKISAIDISTTGIELGLTKVDNTNWNGNILVPNSAKVALISTITDINGCVYKDNFTITIVNPKPITVTLQDKICVNSKGMNLPSGTNGSWECINYPGAVSGNQFLMSPAYYGIIGLRYTEQNNRCTNSRMFNVAVADTSAVTILSGKDLVLCENASPFTPAATPVGGKWEGNFVSQNVFYPNSARNTKNNLVFKFINNEGCVSNGNISIEVVGLPALSIESNKPAICVGDELVLNAHTDMLSLPGSWFADGDGQFSDPDNALTNYVPSANDIQKGIVNFTYTLQTGAVCGNVSEGIDITIKESPSGKINADYRLNKCEPADFRFHSNFTNVTKQDWYINDSLVEEFEYAFPLNVVLNAGVYKIKTIAMNGECTTTDYSEQIEVYSTPVSNFMASPGHRLSREYPRLYLKDITKCNTPFSSQWYFNNTPIEDSKEFYYTVETTDDKFSIKLVNISSVGGCENSVSKEFIFSPINQLYIPDAFSPDAKGPDENNEFKVSGPPMQFFYIEIFNKWGEMVFTSKDMNQGWDGTAGGKAALPGVYFYKINSTDSEGMSRDYSGTVTLIR